MRVVVFGANGQLGREVAAAFKDCDVEALSRADCDVAERNHVDTAIARHRPDLVLNAVAFTDVNGAEADPDAAFRVNALGARWVAQAAARAGAGVVYVSTDYVFDGSAGPYDEWAEPSPLSAYGRSKLAGERETLTHAPRAWVVRTSWLYGGPGKTFVNAIVRAAQTRDELRVVRDEVGGPTLTTDLAAGIRRLFELDAPGLYHLANEGECRRDELAAAALELVGSRTRVVPVSSEEYWGNTTNVAPRPAHSTLRNTAAAALGIRLRPWREALAAHLCASR